MDYYLKGVIGMWCKIMENVESPEKIYTIETDPSKIEEGIYYNVVNGSTTVEISKYLAPNSKMEEFAVSSFRKQLQVQLYVGEELMKTVLATTDRYMFFENNGKAIERLQLIVTATL